MSASAIAAPGLGAYQLNPWALPYLASALLLLGLSLRLARSPRPVDQAFILNMLPVWLTELAIVPLGCARTAEAAFLWSRIANAASGFVGPASLHLVVVAVGWSRQLRWTRVGFLGAAAALAALDLCSHLTISSVWRTQYAWSGRAGPLFPVHMLLIAGSMIPALAILISHVRAAASVIARRRLSYLVLAYAVGCFAVLDFLPYWGLEVTPAAYLPVSFTGLLTYYSIRHERPADLPTVGIRTLTWAALSALVFVPLFVLAWATRSFPGWRDPLVASALLYGLFLALRFYLVRVQPRIDHRFHRRKRDLEAAAARFAERVGVLHTAADLGRAVAQVLEESLYVRLCAFAVAPDDAREASGARRPPEPAPWKIVISAWGSVPPPDPSDPLLRRLGAEAPLLTREAVAQGILSDVRTQAERMFARYGAEALLALAVRRDLRPSGPDARVTSADSGPRWASGRVLGLLAVGPRPGGQPFSDLELDFLDRVRTHTAAALVQARLYERLYRLKLELEEKVAARTQELARAARGLESAQQQLVESEKMSMLGLLVSGVAPDLLSAVESAHGAVPKLIAHLAALQVALDLCRDAAGEVARSELAPREAAARLDYVRRDLGALVDAIAEGARRATAIAQDLRRFARADAAERHQADLHAGIESTLNLLRHELRGGRVRIERDFDPDIPPLECYPGPLNQVFMNLLLNATQAIDDTGTIVIRTRRVDPDRVEVTVRDSGKGIPREHLSRIFEPFFTTKSQGGRSGSGLGLAISYGIVQRHGGRITVESEEGKGTEFRVQLPIRAPGLPPPGSRLPS